MTYAKNVIRLHHIVMTQKSEVRFLLTILLQYYYSQITNNNVRVFSEIMFDNQIIGIVRFLVKT